MTRWLDLPATVDENLINVTKSMYVTPDQVLYATKALKVGLKQHSKLHKVSSSMIGAMRQNYGGNWLCNIRNSEDQMGVRFHGRKEGIFMSFEHEDTVYRV